MKKVDDLGKYLRVPTNKHLAGWKTKCLSLVRRATLIKSTLCAIPAYIMQMACLPWSTYDEIDRRIQHFLYGGIAKASSHSIGLVHKTQIIRRTGHLRYEGSQAKLQKSAIKCHYRVMKTWGHLHKGLNGAIGDGRTTLFLEHRWLSNNPLKELALGPIPTQELDAKVLDYWEPNRGWLWNMVKYLLLHEMLERLPSYELVQEGVGNNFF
ncbi:LOW QUALITY PROTEIN: hypothetical protein Cgig2_030070 [Carnegiea gigantea]|uniref:Uncharacterized protein n=1 Tax=Carnegiea gigantea TaxID=171969 RepID=A0A9Q1GRK7_9CARY|nr:LOW QUALITY PROTEIN: hypothetical protein Cgig2_030070 [Carnegiea gigantea]